MDAQSFRWIFRTWNAMTNPFVSWRVSRLKGWFEMTVKLRPKPDDSQEGCLSNKVILRIFQPFEKDSCFWGRQLSSFFIEHIRHPKVLFDQCEQIDDKKPNTIASENGSPFLGFHVGRNQRSEWIFTEDIQYFIFHEKPPISTQKIRFLPQKERIVFEASIFRCKLAVSFREG